jgi:hypothetical protein
VCQHGIWLRQMPCVYHRQTNSRPAKPRHDVEAYRANPTLPNKPSLPYGRLLFFPARIRKDFAAGRQRGKAHGMCELPQNHRP